MKRLRALVADIDNVYFNIKSERHSYYQALLSLGDRRVAPAIEAAERTAASGAAPSRRPASTATSTSSATARPTRVLPWDIIDGGMKDAFFRGELEKSARAEWTLPPKRATRERAAAARAVLTEIGTSRGPVPARRPRHRTDSSRRPAASAPVSSRRRPATACRRTPAE